MIRRNWMQGFCSLEELESRMAQGLSLDTAEAFCGYYNNDEDNPMLAPELRVLPPERATQTDVLEFASDYHNWYRGPDGGRGGSFHRVTLLRSLQDIFMAYGNPMYDGSGEVPWAAPGITREWLNKSKEERCENPLVIPNFYNAEYNPNGEYNAITYCDGYVRDPDGSFEAKLGRLLPDTARTEPISVVLAIDLNGNNRRDYGEPVVINAHERYNDTGIDGLADEDEPGYDSLTNPDPNNDNWDAFLNPTGTENNWWYDEGKPSKTSDLMASQIPAITERTTPSTPLPRSGMRHRATTLTPSSQSVATKISDTSISTWMRASGTLNTAVSSTACGVN